MNAFRMAVSEWRRLTSGRLPTLAVIAIMLIPTLYAGLYLWANRDPYGALTKVKAAVVVEDQAASSDNGGTIHVGPQIATTLKQDGSFDWQQVDATTAKQGVSDGTYVFSLTIPKGFSAALASTADFEPRKAPLILTTNEANNYLSSTIADQVLAKVTRSIEQNVSQKAASSFLLGFSTIHDQVKKAGEGADKLHSGLVTAKTGASKLATGADQLSTGTGSLVDGTGKLVTGSRSLATAQDQLLAGQKKLDTGIGTAATGATSLHNGAVTLATGADKVAAGNQKIADLGDQLAAASKTANGDLDTLRTQIADQLAQSGLPPQTQQDILTKLDGLRKPLDTLNTQVQGTSKQLDTLASGSQQVATGAHRLADGSGSLADGLGTARSGSSQLVTGQQKARDGSYQLRDGIVQADTGARKLQTGAAQLATGAHDLDSGLGSAVTGAQQLAAGLKDGLGSIPDLDQSQRDQTASTLASPIRTENLADAKAGSYGAGLAPFFCCIGAWVGAYVMFLLVRPLSRRAIAARQGPARTALAGWLTPAVIAMAQVIIMLTVVVRVVDISVRESIPVLLFLVLIAVTFVAIVHALNAWLGPVGQLLGLVLLVMQLASAGGTFPWQTLPPVLQVVHQVLPMTYAVDGLRHLMYGAPLAEVTTDATVLAAYLIGSLALTSAAAYRRRLWTVARIKPEIAL